ncbi:hypothetical protein SD77_2089 [Bacillus badius]|uniref:Uncharacterized protein n=1 Tax=Bacillus badius TaxID=1455 RepID=A0ABR5AYF1_BACBA|nr:hypothetical protein SD78_2446 [Bacillus badius]KIL79635.1 hypothetical protein SD77_2089 [Bacillus badius]
MITVCKAVSRGSVAGVHIDHGEASSEVSPCQMKEAFLTWEYHT